MIIQAEFRVSQALEATVPMIIQKTQLQSFQKHFYFYIVLPTDCMMNTIWITQENFPNTV